MVTGYFANLIEEHFKTGEDFGIRIEYIRQEVQNGTGSALHLAREAIGNEPFYMSFGDIITTPDNYPELIEFYRCDPCDILLTLAHVEDPYRGAAVYVDEDWKVERIVEKPPQGESTTNWNNAGIFVFTPEIFKFTANLRKSERGEYELTDAIRAVMSQDYRVKGFPLQGYWGDIGTPEDVKRMTELLRREQ